MYDEESWPRERESGSRPARPTSLATDDGGPHMRARTWVIATQYNDPSDYGIPELPTWTVSRTAGSGIALAVTADADPFIRAEQPMKVRR